MSDHDIFTQANTGALLMFKGDDEALGDLGSFVLREKATGKLWAVKSLPGDRWDIYAMTPDGNNFRVGSREVATVVRESTGSYTGREYTENHQINPPLKVGTSLREVVVRSALWPL